MNKDLDTRLKQRLEDYLNQRAIQEKTKNYIKSRLSKYLTYLSDNNLELEDIDLEKAQKYKNILDKQSYHPAYISRLLRDCIGFYNYLLQIKIIKTNPFDILWRKVKGLEPEFEYPYLDDFCKNYKSKNYFRQVLIKLFDYLRERKIAIENVSEKTAQTYLEKLRAQKEPAAATKDNYIRLIITFYYYLKDKGIVNKNPFTKQDKIHREKSELILLYEKDVACRGLRKGTISSYRQAIYFFLDYLNEKEMNEREIRIVDAIAYLDHLFNKYSKKVVAYQIEALKSYYDFLFRRNLVYFNPFKGLRRLTYSRKIPRNLPNEKAMDELLEKAKDFNQGNRFERISKYKLHVIFELLYSTGMRSSEASKLRAEDIDFNKGTVHIREGKGGMERIALLNDYSKEVLKIYIQIHPLLHNTSHKRNNTLFGMSPKRFGMFVNDGLKNYGNYTSHFFRHSVGYHLLKAGCDIRYIQEILGHETLKSTEIYTKVDKEDLRNIIDKYHPRQWHETR